MYHPIASVFPTISELNVFKEQVGEKDEIRHMLQDNGYTVSSYIISAESTFDNPYAVECRGLVFDARGRLAARPLHKFFNLNEKPSTRAEVLDWSRVKRVMDKRDGSMIHTVRVDEEHAAFKGAVQGHNTFDVKSKKSFKSDVANQARAWIAARPEYVNFCQSVTDKGLTAIFEWTSPTARIVLPYQQDGLQLLHIRDNMTGRYLSLGELSSLAMLYDVQVLEPTESALKLQQLIELDALAAERSLDVGRVLLQMAEDHTDIEGWVIQFHDGNMVKVKTKWYLERHRAMTFLRERDIVLMVLRESLDDLKALLVGEGVNIAELNLLEERTVTEIRALEHKLEQALAATEGMTKKEAALRFGPKGEGFELFGLLMNMMDGKEPDIKGWYERHVLPTISLRQLNLMQSVAEAE